MAVLDISVLDDEESGLARVLLKTKAIKEEALGKYLRFKKKHDHIGKKQLGGILLNLGFITQDDIRQYMKESNVMHLEFCESMLQQGLLAPEQKNLLFKKHDETGEDIINLIIDLKIMTRDNFSRIFNKRIRFLRLGEWLVVNEKVSQEQIDKAKGIQGIHSLADYLVAHGHCSRKTINRVADKISGA